MIIEFGQIAVEFGKIAVDFRQVTIEFGLKGHNLTPPVSVLKLYQALNGFSIVGKSFMCFHAF